MGPPMLGAKEALERLKQEGHTILIHSCNRANVIAEWMAYFNITYSSIWCGTGKPVADVYIDDKGLKFESWQQTLTKILTL